MDARAERQRRRAIASTRSSAKPTTAGSMTFAACTCVRRTCSRRSPPRATARSRRAASAPGPARAPSDGRAASAPRRDGSIARTADTRSACWCKAITAACLTMGGAPVGKELGRFAFSPPRSGSRRGTMPGDGSCMIVVATDAPIDARDLKRLAARAVFGLARTGSSYSQRQRRLCDCVLDRRRPADAGRRRGAAAAHGAAGRWCVAALPGGARSDRRSRLQLAAESDDGHEPRGDGGGDPRRQGHRDSASAIARSRDSDAARASGAHVARRARSRSGFDGMARARRGEPTSHPGELWPHATQRSDMRSGLVCSTL